MPVYRILIETDDSSGAADGGGRWRPIANCTFPSGTVAQPFYDWSDLQAAIAEAVATSRVQGGHLRVIDRDSRDIRWDTPTDGPGSSG